ERYVNFAFGFRGDDLAPATQPLGCESHALIHRPSLQSFDVLTGSGCKEQGNAEAARVSQIDRHLAGGNYLGWTGEPFDLRDQSQVRNELATAAEVACGGRTDNAGPRPLQRFGSRAGQLVGAMQMARSRRGFPDLQAFEDFALHRRTQALDAFQ